MVRFPADIELATLSSTSNKTVSTAPPASVPPPSWNPAGVESANCPVRLIDVSKNRIDADVNETTAPPLFWTTMRTSMGRVWSVVKFGCDGRIVLIATPGASSTKKPSVMGTFTENGSPFSVPSIWTVGE